MLNNPYLKFIGCFIILLFSIHPLYSIEQHKNNSPIIDLQHISINKDTEINLESGWEFYWNQLLEPTDFNINHPFKLITLNNWTQFNTSNEGKIPSFGYATYRLKVSLPKKSPSLSLFIPRIHSSSKIWLNNQFISETGRVGKLKTTTQHRRFSQIIPIDTSKESFEIIIQVSNFYHSQGGINTPLILGTNKHLHSIKSKRIIADILFVGCIGFIGVFFLLFYFFYWSKDQAVLYFSILCISLSYNALSDRYAPITAIMESANWVLLTKIEYLSLFLAAAAAGLFFNDLFFKFVHKLYSKVLIYIFSLLGLLVIFLPTPFFTKLISPFMFLMLTNLLYVLFVTIKTIILKRDKNILLLACILLGSLTFYLNIFFFLKQNVNVLIYINFAYILVFLLLSMLLMNRFSNSFEELERSKVLALEQKKEISIKSNELSNLNLKLESNLKQLENYNTELDDFNHIVSHDLKSPLVSVYSLVSFIEEDLKTSLDEGTKYHLKLLKDVVSKMNALINGLLEYSKVAKGNKRKELFSLNDLLSSVISIVDNQNKSTINLLDKDVEIYANKIELEHVFQNLITNAIKHNDKEKAIINFSVSQLNNEYLFSINDNGPGIDPEYHTKIFKIFSQLKINDDVNSTGIGLAIVKKIITENQGVITIESQKGIGVTINFSWVI